MRIYISGPITGYEMQLVRFRFYRAEKKLREMGHDVVNPIDMGEWGLSWRTYMALAKVTLSSRDIDAMYLMPGWSASRGCRLEKKWAEELHIPILYSIDTGKDGGNEWMLRNI